MDYGTQKIVKQKLPREICNFSSRQDPISPPKNAAVNGLDDRELHKLRTALLKATTPHHGSHKRQLATKGDPAWKEALAPFRR